MELYGDPFLIQPHSFTVEFHRFQPILSGKWKDNTGIFTGLGLDRGIYKNAVTAYIPGCGLDNFLADDGVHI